MVGFALIPNHATHRVRRHRCNHRVVETGEPPWFGGWFVGIAIRIGFPGCVRFVPLRFLNTVKLDDVAGEFRAVIKGLAWHPAIKFRAAEIRLNQPNWHILRNAYLVGKPRRNGTDPVESKPLVVDRPPLSIVAHTPARMLKRSVSSDVCKGLIRDIGADLEATQRRVGDELARFLGVGGLGNAESHVGLAGCQPYFSHEDILQADGRAAHGHFQLLSSSIRLHGIEFDHPFT